MQQCVERLESEIHLEFSRTMNQITFDKLVQANPEEFFNITVPEKEPERVPDKGLCVYVDTCIYRDCLLWNTDGIRLFRLCFSTGLPI